MSTAITPFWIERLAARGLSEATIAHFGLTPRGEGWQYPVHPAIEAMRWKAFDSRATPKYLWLPNKPDAVRFYDCDGRLHAAVTGAGGVLWLASGEADVWALWEGGIPNATSLFDGEARKIPAWFVPRLEALDVQTLHMAPDRDPTGRQFVLNVARALADTGIRVLMHRLPFPPRSKGDIGRLLVEVGAGNLQTALSELRTYEVVFEPFRERVRQLPLPNLFANNRKLYEQWSVEVVEAAAQMAWDFSGPDRKGFSKNFRCPFHDDRHPSAGWSYRSHGVNCFACGYHGTKEVAEMLGV